MAKVECEIEETPDGVQATCGDCDHCVDIPKAKLTPEIQQLLLAKLRSSCPNREYNKYVPVE